MRDLSLKIRPATSADEPRIAEIIFDDPPPESVWMTGSKRKARALGRVMARMSNSEMGWQNTTLAERDGNVIGLLQPGTRDEGGIEIGPALVFHTLRIIGLGVPRLLHRMRVRESLDMKRPANSYHISELHVDKAYRGQGVGGALLDHAEKVARESGFSTMSLVTATSNPARRLYERHGFTVVEERTHPEYEAGTGSAGRVLMTKRLDA